MDKDRTIQIGGIKLSPLEIGDMIVLKVDTMIWKDIDGLKKFREQFIKLNQLESYNVIIASKDDDVSILSRSIQLEE